MVWDQGVEGSTPSPPIFIFLFEFLTYFHKIRVYILSEKKNIDINPLLEKLRETRLAGTSDNDYFKSFDGINIFYRTWKPSKKIEKIIIVAHGMAGHGEFFVLLADKLVNQGIMVIAPDYRNHGHSEGKKGDLKKFKYLLKDLYYFINFIKELYPNIPISLFGESMGGTVSINYAKKFPEEFSRLSSLILFAPGVKLNLPKIFWFRIALLILPIIIIRLLFPSKRIIPAKGREESGIKNSIHQQYDKTDPFHLEKLSLRYIIQIFKYIRKSRKIAPKISIPTIIFQGTKDRGISCESVKKFYKRIASKDKEIIMVENGYHALITDPSFQDKWMILINWLKFH